MKNTENRCVHCNNLEECLWIAKRRPDFLRHCNYFGNITKVLEKEGTANMHEYIKRTDAINEVNRGDLLVGDNAEWAREIIWRTPYADVAPVKHAHWIEVKIPTGVEAFGYKEMMVAGFKCSLCKENVDVSEWHYRYCPYCGSKMR